MTELEILRQLKVDLENCNEISNLEIYYEETIIKVIKHYIGYPKDQPQETKTGKWVILADWKCYMQNRVGVNSHEKFKVDPSKSVQVRQLLLDAEIKIAELTGSKVNLSLTKRR